VPVTARVGQCLAAFLVAGLVAGLGCGSAGDVATGTFTIQFPSTAAAIAVAKHTQGVQVFAYSVSAFGDASAEVAGACQTLVEQSRTNNLTAIPIAKSEVVTPCDLMAGKGTVALAYGSYAFLAVVKSSGNDYLVGCAEQTITSTNTVVTILMTLASSTEMVPTTSCTSLSQACPNATKC
jgi:hypothetical protein